MASKELPKYMQLKEEILSWLYSGRLKPEDQMPSENEIAAQFGFSRQTVRQALGELEQEGWLYRAQGKGTFVSAPAARAAKGSQTVGIVTTYISDYIFPHIVRGAEAVLRSRGYGLMLSSTDNDKAKEKDSLRRMLAQPLGGLIVEPTRSAQGNPNLNEFLAMAYYGIPFVMINERYPELDCPCLKVDDEAGGYRAAEHLIALGHRRIAGFFKTDDLQGSGRMKGFIRAHREHRVPIMTDAIVYYSTEEKTDKPLEAALAMLRREERPTGFVCYNDELAVLLMGAIRRAGLAVPDDISIVGFDDSSLALAGEVRLTTLTHPKAAMGEQAAKLLLDRMEGRAEEGSAGKDIVYEPELIVRDSTRAADGEA